MLIAILVLIVIVLIVAAFLPKEFRSERTVVIEKPSSEVFNYLKYVKNQDNFGVWQLSDPDMQTSEEGIDGTVGFKYSWEGEKTGKGSQTITGISEGERIDTELDFGFGEPAQAYFVTEAEAADRTQVTWGMSGRSPYPWNIMGLFFDVGNDFEKGLQNLKEILESRDSPTGDQAVALNYYQETMDNLAREVSGLTRAQLHFHPSPDAWSISQCLEHIILTEEMLFGMIRERMSEPANPERRAEVKLADHEIASAVTDRSQKYQAPEALTGTGKYDDPQIALQELKTQRAPILAFIQDTPSEELRNRVNDSPIGASDSFQSLLFLAGHTARHTLQIAEIKSHPDFPGD